jgi:hypothetical protein
LPLATYAERDADRRYLAVAATAVLVRDLAWLDAISSDAGRLLLIAVMLAPAGLVVGGHGSERHVSSSKPKRKAKATAVKRKVRARANTGAKPNKKPAAKPKKRAKRRSMTDASELPDEVGRHCLPGHVSVVARLADPARGSPAHG